MPTESISFNKTGYFSPLISDYIDESENLKDFYNNYPEIENFKNQIEVKQKSFNPQLRQLLADCLEKQYQDIPISESTSKNIQSSSQ